MIVIVDYGLGNVHSILSKIRQINEPALISSEISIIENADKLILPGIGSFDSGMLSIEQLGLTEILKKKILKEKNQILGICLGMQLFGQKSGEGIKTGLGLTSYETRKFQFPSGINYPIPHMGWNTIKIQEDCSLLKGIPNNSRYYFAHSYHVNCKEKIGIVTLTHYGYDFPSIIQHDNIFGVQFHPEKSHKQGIQLLRNFVMM